MLSRFEKPTALLIVDQMDDCEGLVPVMTLPRLFQKVAKLAVLLVEVLLGALLVVEALEELLVGFEVAEGVVLALVVVDFEAAEDDVVLVLVADLELEVVTSSSVSHSSSSSSLAVAVAALPLADVVELRSRGGVLSRATSSAAEEGSERLAGT